MATRKRRRKAAHNPRRVTRRRHAVVSHRRRRRNPAGFSARGLMGTVVTGVKDAALGVAGMGVTRVVRSKLGFEAGSAMGSVVELVGGIALGMLGQRFLGADGARAVTQGAFMGPVIAMVKKANVPLLADALGDDMGLYGPGSSYGYLYGYPAPGLAGYPTAPLLAGSPEEYAVMAGM